jgi:hypothetical protein
MARFFLPQAAIIVHNSATMEGNRPVPSAKRTALTVWWGICVFLLLGPAVLVWAVRGFAFAAACTPGPGLCHGMALGVALRDTLAVAWMVSTNAPFLISVALLAAIMAFVSHRPVAGTLSFLALPLLSLALPALAVRLSVYDGCRIDADGVGICDLWGARMGASFHAAAGVPDLLCTLTPLCVAIAVMLGTGSWVLIRAERRKTRVHRGTAMAMRELGKPIE